jgi:DUF438 domain-containing protein
MSEMEIMEAILDSIEYPIIFVDTDFIIKYLNKRAREEYYEKRKIKNLIGKEIYHCHPPQAKEALRKAFKELTETGDNELFLYESQKVKSKLYLRAVRNKEGQLIGFYQRYASAYNPLEYLPK